MERIVMSPFGILIKSMKQSYCKKDAYRLHVCQRKQYILTNSIMTYIYIIIYLYSYLQQQYTKSIEYVNIIHLNSRHFHAP